MSRPVRDQTLRLPTGQLHPTDSVFSYLRPSETLRRPPAGQQTARRHLAHERKDHTMQSSSLVQEAFLRLVPGRDLGWQDRAHFCRAASCVMRHVLVDHARQRRRAKRGNDAVHIPIDVATVLSPDEVEEVVAIDLALQRLAALDERKSDVLEMRLFGGLSIEETAAALGIAPNTVLREFMALAATPPTSSGPR